MRFFSFHFMGYRGLDAEKAVAEHDVSWCTLPNGSLDPHLMAGDYRDYLDQVALADQLGFDGVAVNEHHQTPFGTMPNPNVMAGAITQRTTRARIAVLGNALPLRATPLATAEEYAMLDLLSGGRLEAGFVVGGGPEFYNFAKNPTEARERFAEGLALVRRAWTESGPFRFDGKYYALDCVNPWPLPLQQPHPPIWVCGVGSPTTLDMCAREDLSYMGVNFQGDPLDFQRQCEFFRGAAQRHGVAYDPHRLGWLTNIHVAESDEQAQAEVAEHRSYAATLTRGFIGSGKTFFPPGHMPPEALVAWEKEMRAVVSGEITRRDSAIAGTPGTVRRILTQRLCDFQVGNVVIAFQQGSASNEVVTRSMRLFAEEVMPLVRRDVDDYFDGLYPDRLRTGDASAPAAVTA